MKNFLRLLFALCCFLPRSLGGQDPGPVVHAVLFYSPTCPHCHQVITEYLIPLQNRFGNSLVILGMDTTKPEANNLYWETIRCYKVSEENWAVPFLVVGDEVLVGGLEIPNRFTTIVESGLASGGIDLPDYPALRAFLQEQDLLDPRFPDRLVMTPRPAPEPEASGSTPADEAAQAEAGPDTLEPGAPPSSPDSAVAVDTHPADPGAGATDTTPGEVGASDTAAGQPAVGSGDTVRSGNTASGIAPGSEPGPGAGGESGVPGAEARPSPDSPASRPGVAPSGADTVGAGVQAARQPPEKPPGGSMIRGLDEAASEFESMTMWDRFRLDPVGNGISVVVLLIMLGSLVLRGVPVRTAQGEGPSWVVPALVSAGVLVAGYLSFIEVTQVQAVCGPVGDCNTVNQSEYAVLFGRIPVGILGLMGYAAVLGLWWVARAGPTEARRPATLALWAAVLFGVLFSVYLTFLEPFVIGASCAWCLTSALIMTLLLWAVTPLASRARFGGGGIEEEG